MTDIVGFPRLEARIVDPETGTLTRPWYEFLRQIFLRIGGASSSVVNGALSTMNNVFLISLGSITRSMLAGIQKGDGNVVQCTPLEGSAEQGVVLGVSPFVYTAGFQGTLVVFGAGLEVSRDSGTTWHQVSLTGCPLPMLAKDQARITWRDPGSPPSVVFLPSGVIA